MKKSRLSVAVILVSVLLAACTGEDITTEKTTEQPKEPVIVLGDENLPEPELPGDTEEDDDVPVSASGNTEEPEVSPKPSASQNAAETPASVSGPVLVIGAAPKNAVLESSGTDGAGGYTETLLCEDGKIRLYLERGKNGFSERTLQEVQRYYGQKGEWKQVTLAGEDDTLAGAVGFPVFRFRYVTGEGEESVMHNMIYIAHDEYDFVLDASAEASDYPDLEELTEIWIGTVSIFNEG